MASPASRSLFCACRHPHAGPPPVCPRRDGLVVLVFFAFVLDLPVCNLASALLFLPAVWLDVFYPFR